MPVYLLHLAEPVCGVSHYVGYTANLTRRLQEHHRGVLGKTSKLMQQVTTRGIGFTHVNTFDCGDLTYDRQLETQLHTKSDSYIANMYCPICMKNRKA